MNAELDEYDDPESWDVPDGWTAEGQAEIADLATATELSRKLRGVRRRMEALAAQAEAEIDRLQRRAVEIAAPLTRREEWLVAQLEAYALYRRQFFGEKTTKLLYAEVKTTEAGGGWTADADAVDWARWHAPDLLATNPKFKISDAKLRPGWKVDGGQVLDTTTGEYIPGITVAPKRVQAVVKPILDGDAA